MPCTPDIIPDIEANNTDMAVTILTDDTLWMTVKLAAKNIPEINADWWVAADTPLGWYYYTHPDIWTYASDLDNVRPAYQGPIFDLSPVDVLNVKGLPVGTYTFYFGIDTDMNGQIDFEQLYLDDVSVDVIP